MSQSTESFISRPWGGRCSDKLLTEKSGSSTIYYEECWGQERAIDEVAARLTNQQVTVQLRESTMVRWLFQEDGAMRKAMSEEDSAEECPSNL